MIKGLVIGLYIGLGRLHRINLYLLKSIFAPSVFC